MKPIIQMCPQLTTLILARATQEPGKNHAPWSNVLPEVLSRCKLLETLDVSECFPTDFSYIRNNFLI